MVAVSTETVWYGNNFSSANVGFYFSSLIITVIRLLLQPLHFTSPSTTTKSLSQAKHGGIMGPEGGLGSVQGQGVKWLCKNNGQHHPVL